MQCPRCKTHDVYISQRENQSVLSLLWVKVRCHRCCNLFSAPRWLASHNKPSASARKAA